MIRVACFLLDDPPPGQEQTLRDTIAAIDYPWERLRPALERDHDKGCVVRWADTGQRATGLYYGGSRIEIHLGTRYAGWQEGVPFVFTHEVGHLVDHATLTDTQRAALIDLVHASPATRRYDGRQFNGAEHPWSHRQPHRETWRAGDVDYLFRHHEAFADLFVQTFAPSLFRSVRFVHTTDDFDAVRAIVLRDPPVPDPPEEDAVRRIKVAVDTDHHGNGVAITDIAWRDFLCVQPNSGYNGTHPPIPRVAAQDYRGRTRVEVQAGPSNARVDVFVVAND